MAGSSGGSGPTFYETLGVEEDASVAELRAAYRERAKDTHPDVNDAPDARRRFRRIKRAHEVLTDEQERRRYDRLGHEAYVGLEDRERDGDGTGDATGSPAGHRRTGAEPSGDAAPAGGPGSGRSDGATGRTRTGTGTGTGTTGGSGRGGPEGRTPGGPTAGRPGGSAGHAADARGGRETESGAGPAAERGRLYRAAYRAARWLTVAVALVDAWQARLSPAAAATALATFAAYPVLLASTVTPLFPVAVNLVVGAFLFGVLAYLVLRPAVGVAVLGAWLLLLPVALTITGVGVVSFGGLYAVVLTGVPLVLCVATILGGVA